MRVDATLSFQELLGKNALGSSTRFERFFDALAGFVFLPEVTQRLFPGFGILTTCHASLKVVCDVFGQSQLGACVLRRKRKGVESQRHGFGVTLSRDHFLDHS